MEKIDIAVVLVVFFPYRLVFLKHFFNVRFVRAVFLELENYVVGVAFPVKSDSPCFVVSDFLGLTSVKIEGAE